MQYRFGVFEVDVAAGELRRQGLRVRMHRQPFEVLCLLLARPGEVVTREEIAGVLWAEGTFVDFEHGVNAAMGRLREALRDRASAPRYIETLPRRGYRWLVPVEVIGPPKEDPSAVASIDDQGAAAAGASQGMQIPFGKNNREDGAGQGLEGGQGLTQMPFGKDNQGSEEAGEPVSGHEAVFAGKTPWLTTPEVLPRLPGQTSRGLFLLLQGMYLLFSVLMLANLAAVRELLQELSGSEALFVVAAALAACGIPLRLYLGGLAGLRPPGARARFLRLWPMVLAVDLVMALSPLLLVDHISFGLALACVCPLVYAPFAERSLVLMGAV